jgi:hypothetical protein
MAVALECGCRRSIVVVIPGISTKCLDTALSSELVTGDPIVAIAKSTICF